MTCERIFVGCGLVSDSDRHIMNGCGAVRSRLRYRFHSVHRTTADRMAAHRKLDRRSSSGRCVACFSERRICAVSNCVGIRCCRRRTLSRATRRGTRRWTSHSTTASTIHPFARRPPVSTANPARLGVMLASQPHPEHESTRRNWKSRVRARSAHSRV
jgi:hypothetical protein